MLRTFLKSLFIICLLTIGIASKSYADASTGFGQIFNVIFGSEDARQLGSGSQKADCNVIDGDGGIIGVINGIFCHMKYDMGLSGIGTSTKTFGALKVHAQFTNACLGSDGYTYLYGAQVWVCQPGQNCSSTSNFSRALSMCFTTDTSLNTNKGILVMDNGAFGADPGNGAMLISYDLGKTSASQKIKAQMVFHNLGNGHFFYGRADGTRTDANHISGTMLFVDNAIVAGSSGRFAFTLNRSNNTVMAYMEGMSAAGNGTGVYNASAASDSPSTGICATRSASGNDWSYSVTSNGVACAPSVTFPSDSLNAVGAYTYGGIVGTWQGMSATPPSL